MARLTSTVLTGTVPGTMTCAHTAGTVIGMLAAVFVIVQATGVKANLGPLPVECTAASERAERAAAALIPGRTWTWALDFRLSLQQLDELRRLISALGTCERQFEGILTPEQYSEAEPALRSLKAALAHIERDAASLDSELRKDYPTRFHVARDASDMRLEIRKWWTLLQRTNATTRTDSSRNR